MNEFEPYQTPAAPESVPEPTSDALTYSDPVNVPEPAPRPVYIQQSFAPVSLRELLAALVSYVAAYIYIHMAFFADDPNVWLPVFGGVATVGVGAFFHDRLKTREHWVWLVCLWICILTMICGRDQVWIDYTWLFIHCFFIYWVWTLSGRTLMGGSSAWLPLDALNAAVIEPFRNFFSFYRTRVLFHAFKDRAPREKKALSGLWWGLLALVIGIVLFIVAGNLLAAADRQFNKILFRFLDLFRKWDHEAIQRYFLCFLLSIPVGAWLLGLVAGPERRSRAHWEAQKTGGEKFLASLKKVPEKVWIGVTLCFAALYLVFFFIQGTYLFSAFFGTLPKGFTVAQYARRGFFELCKIMALNFALLWLMLYSSQNRSGKLLLGVSTVLLGESLLFAVTALSKLWLYISCFGFTPLRLQSLWLVCVLTVGCICTLVSLWTAKKPAKLWILFTGITLALLHLY